MTSRERTRAFWLLGAALFVSFRLFILDTGLYHDDWILLEHTIDGGSWWGAVQVFAAKGILARPLQAFIYPLLYSLAGAAPASGQALLFVLDWLEAFLLYLLIARLTRSEKAALLAAGLCVLFPNRAVMHVWISNAFQPMAHVALLAGFLAHLNWMESGKKVWLAASLSCYLVSLLCYESAAFLPLMLAGAFWTRMRLDGTAPFPALKKSLAPLAPFILPLAAALWWQRQGVQLFFPDAGIKALSPSVYHFVKAYAAGVHCLTTGVLLAAARTLPEAWSQWPWPLKLAWPAAAAALWILLRPSLKYDGPDGRTALILLGAGAGAFVGSYAPFALSGTYTPQFFGLMSRTNGSGAWAGGLMLAAALTALSSRAESGQRGSSQKGIGGLGGRSAASALLALVLGVFTWTNWQFAREWANSWTLQRKIIAQAAPQAKNLPPSATVLLNGIPRYLGSAVVFDASWDFAYALRASLGRKDISGNVVSHRMSFEAEGAVERTAGQVIWTRPYAAGLYLYDYGRDTLVRLDGPPKVDIIELVGD